MVSIWKCCVVNAMSEGRFSGWHDFVTSGGGSSKFQVEAVRTCNVRRWVFMAVCICDAG